MGIMLMGCGGNLPENGEVGSAENTQQSRYGITLTAENVTSTGLTLVCSQSGGEGIKELLTGSDYVLLKLDGDKTEEVPFAAENVAWTMEAYIVTLEGSVSWDVNWEYIYGELSAGNYRLVKTFSNFKGPGDSETEEIFVDFTIQ